MEIYRAYKFSLYPTDEQKILIHKTFDCKRFVYNYYLNYLKENKNKKMFNLYNDLINLKRDNEFLKEVDVCSLRSAIFDLVDGLNDYYAKKQVTLNLKIDLVNNLIELIVQKVYIKEKNIIL